MNKNLSYKGVFSIAPSSFIDSQELIKLARKDIPVALTRGDH